MIYGILLAAVATAPCDPASPGASHELDRERVAELEDGWIGDQFW